MLNIEKYIRLDRFFIVEILSLCSGTIKLTKIMLWLVLMSIIIKTSVAMQNYLEEYAIIEIIFRAKVKAP